MRNVVEEAADRVLDRTAKASPAYFDLMLSCFPSTLMVRPWVKVKRDTRTLWQKLRRRPVFAEWEPRGSSVLIATKIVGREVRAVEGHTWPTWAVSREKLEACAFVYSTVEGEELIRSEPYELWTGLKTLTMVMDDDFVIAYASVG